MVLTLKPSTPDGRSAGLLSPSASGVLLVSERHMPGAGTSLPNLRDGKNLHVAASHRARVTYLAEQRRGAPGVHRQEMKMAPQESHCSF